MGIAILSGILSSLNESKNELPSTSQESLPGSSTPEEPISPRLPSRFIACVRRSESNKRINAALGDHSARVKVLLNQNLQGVREADVVLLCCKPQMFRDILDSSEVVDALKGKLLISILAGVTVHQLEEHLYGSISDRDPEQDGRCRIIRVIPNTAASVRESMTVIANSTPPLSPEQSSLVNWIFNSIGRVVRLPQNTLDASTALCGSGPAFMALVLEAIADGILLSTTRQWKWLADTYRCCCYGAATSRSSNHGGPNHARDDRHGTEWRAPSYSPRQG